MHFIYPILWFIQRYSINCPFLNSYICRNSTNPSSFHPIIITIWVRSEYNFGSFIHFYWGFQLFLFWIMLISDSLTSINLCRSSIYRWSSSFSLDNAICCSVVFLSRSARRAFIRACISSASNCSFCSNSYLNSFWRCSCSWQMSNSSSSFTFSSRFTRSSH